MPGIRRRIGSPAKPRRKPAAGGPSLLAFFFWTIFMVSAAISYLWIYNQTDIVAATLEENRKQVAELENSSRELQVAIDHLSQIDRITSIARGQLGMYVPPAESLIVYVPEPNL